MTKDHRVKVAYLSLACVPLAVLGAGFAFASHCWPFSTTDYEHYRAFWGGNPNEVFSHWLDSVIVSGNGFSIAWLLTLEASARQRLTTSKKAWFKLIVLLFFLLSILTGVALDHQYGEGTVMYAALIGFLPLLGSWFYLLRKIATFYDWIPKKVLIVSVIYVVLNVAAQLFYEPSGTGGPNVSFLFFWFGSMAAAGIAALGLGLRSGSLARFCCRTLLVIRRPFVWVPLLVLFLAIAIPLTMHARQIRQPRQTLAMKWLNDIEILLSDEIVRDLKICAIDNPPYEKMAIPASARELLNDSRIALGNSLRVYVPLTNGEYLFLWANDHFNYCDVRPLNNSQYGTVEMDQDFIDGLREHEGTFETGLYSVLWSPYLGGRVIKTKSGDIKAICVIKSPD